MLAVCFLQKVFQPALFHFRQNDGRAEIGSIFSHGKYDLASQITTERLYVVQHIFQFRSATFLLLLPPVAQFRTLLQPVLEYLAGLSQGIGKIRNCSKDHGMDRYFLNAGAGSGFLSSRQFARIFREIHPHHAFDHGHT